MNRKYIIYTSIISLIAFVVVFYSLYSTSHTQILTTTRVATSEQNSSPTISPTHEATPRGLVVKVQPTQQPNSTLTVEGTTYRAYVPEGITALDLMRILASTTDFTFAGRDYPALGFFVESINGKKSANGYYWFLYVNGKSSDTGASQTAIHAGDTVEWRYEKSH